MFMTIEPIFDVDEELAALLADFDAIAAADPGLVVETALADLDVVAPVTDPAPVVDPMTDDDGSVFADLSAPGVSDAGVPASPVDVMTLVASLDDAALSDLTATFDVDAMLLAGDFAFDLEALILAVGQNLESLNFSPFQ